MEAVEAADAGAGQAGASERPPLSEAARYSSRTDVHALPCRRSHVCNMTQDRTWIVLGETNLKHRCMHAPGTAEVALAKNTRFAEMSHCVLSRSCAGRFSALSQFRIRRPVKASFGVRSCSQTV